MVRFGLDKGRPPFLFKVSKDQVRINKFIDNFRQAAGDHPSRDCRVDVGVVVLVVIQNRGMYLAKIDVSASVVFLVIHNSSLHYSRGSGRESFCNACTRCLDIINIHDPSSCGSWVIIIEM